MLPPVFQSPGNYRAAFDDGIERMLFEHNSLGVFILALANAAIDPATRARLNDRLKQRFEALSVDAPDAIPDDQEVVAALLRMGWDAIEPVRLRPLERFELQYNPLRGLRPARGAGARVCTLRCEFSPAGFHFAKPFLRKETFWRGELLGHEVALLYNKFPFLPLHALLVPEPDAGYPQFLTESWHRYVWRLASALGETLPGFAIGYNAYGANASVNHLHFQPFRRNRPLPVASPRWSHNGGDQPYPTTCLRFDDMDAAWRKIRRLHAANQPYNLLFVASSVYCLPRRFQGIVQGAEWAQRHAFYEMCGGLTVLRIADYDALGDAAIAAGLAPLRPD